MMNWQQKENSAIWQRLRKISASVITVICIARWPSKAAEDAVMLDSSDLNIDEVVEAIYEHAKKAGLGA